MNVRPELQWDPVLKTKNILKHMFNSSIIFVLRCKFVPKLLHNLSIIWIFCVIECCFIYEKKKKNTSEGRKQHLWFPECINYFTHSQLVFHIFIQFQITLLSPYSYSQAITHPLSLPQKSIQVFFKRKGYMVSYVYIF
jgi:hypothetical protein